MKKTIPIIIYLIISAIESYSLEKYKNIDVAIICRTAEVNKMDDSIWLDRNFTFIEKHVKVSKVYLEVNRDRIKTNPIALKKAKKYFQKKGIITSGCVATIVNEKNNFEPYCYSDNSNKEELLEFVRYGAQNFDELIFDDFYFTNCTCNKCYKAKANKGWADFRVGLLTDFARQMVEEAKSVNPKVNMIIKYPNWYEHFHFLGYNLRDEPDVFDMIYTGTETRDPIYHKQHLQPYNGYSLMRYFDNIAPGKNGGGWVDPYTRGFLDRYSDQLLLTLYAKPKEVSLFCFEELVDEYIRDDNSVLAVSDITPLAGYTFELADFYLQKLGKPIGIPCYKPYFSSTGEDYLHSYLGMIGLPLELTPVWPSDESMVLLNESARYDENIIDKIKNHLEVGKDIVITSGLLKALQNKGIEDIIEVLYTDKKVFVNEFTDFKSIYRSNKEIMIPQLKYSTNQVWEIISTYKADRGFPVLLKGTYSSGNIYVLNIPASVQKFSATLLDKKLQYVILQAIEL